RQAVHSPRGCGEGLSDLAGAEQRTEDHRVWQDPPGHAESVGLRAGRGAEPARGVRDRDERHRGGFWQGRVDAVSGTWPPRAAMQEQCGRSFTSHGMIARIVSQSCVSVTVSRRSTRAGETAEPSSTTGTFWTSCSRSAVPTAASRERPSACAVSAYTNWNTPTLPGVSRRRKPTLDVIIAAMLPATVMGKCVAIAAQ